MAFASMSFPFQSKCLQVILIFYVNLLFLQHIKAASALGNETDYLALLNFKDSIPDDPYEILSSWNSSNHFCNWNRITCSRKHQRVTELELRGCRLRGTISPHVGNLSFLRNLYLDNNFFYGEIPPEIGRLFRLQQLSLRDNTLTGDIPINLTRCSELRHLDLSGNSLSGKIPFLLGSLGKLEKLNISINSLDGQIPTSLWNLSSLDGLSVAYNNLEGSIPDEIGHLENLRTLSFAGNKLSGSLPLSLYNMSSLTLISAGANQLSDTRLPDNIFSTLSNLQTFAIGVNQISGSIPSSITNASFLQNFDISTNSFVGKVPDLGGLKDLRWLNLEHNNLGGNNSNNDLDFITSLKNNSKLEGFSLSYNKFGGALPNSIGNLSSQFIQLILGGNQIYGTIPETLGKYTNLIALALEYNQFSGTIPPSLGNIHKMQILSLGGNQLLGEIPASVGNLSRLIKLSFSENMLEGKIPPIFGNMGNLLFLDLAKNNLSGTIPLQVFGLSSLSISLDLSCNKLNGSLPIVIGTLKNLGRLNISENHLFGEIPRSIGECESMEYLDLRGNSFNGTMPPSLASLKGLKHLDLSRNNLSGSIPISLQTNSVLEYLNVSFNGLEGEVPIEGVFSNASTISLVGNNKLCGGVSKLHLPPCPVRVVTRRKNLNSKLLAIIVCVAFSLLLISILALYRMRKRNRKPSSNSPTTDQLHQVSYQNLRYATEGFSTINLIGSGSFSSVYKGRIESEDRIVAIKVLNLHKKGAQKSFISECNALRNIRHRNLVKILTCCSSIDYEGNQFQALVFEYMSNGSLEKWLHPGPESAYQPRTLDLRQRLNIVYDIAYALHYLHYECEQPVVHCDLKPSNVLLDDDMVAHVSDFGLARILSTINGSSQKQTSTNGIKGTIGYAPPEYGIGSAVSTEGDVYSFGILVLEMFTGRRPTDEMFKDGHNLHNYVKAAYPNNLLEIVDPAYLPQQIHQTATTTEEEIGMEKIVDSAHLPQQIHQTATATEEEIDMEERTLMHPNDEKSIFSLFGIGLACSVESPKERVNMMDVIRKLNQIEKNFV